MLFIFYFVYVSVIKDLKEINNQKLIQNKELILNITNDIYIKTIMK